MELTSTNVPVPLLLTRDPISIRVPNPPFGARHGYVRVMLLSKSQLVGFWEFRVEFSPPALKLVLLVSRLDQCFITVDHPNNSPVAYRFELFALPEEMGNLILQVETEPHTHNSRYIYHLKWPSKNASEKCLTTWHNARIPPVEWFHVELTTHCNLSCPFCPSSILERSQAFMTLELARRVFQQISDYCAKHPSTFGYTNLNRMVFLHVMGEPLLHPKLKEIVSMAREHGILSALFTNIALLNDNNIKKLFDSGISHVTLSFNVVNDTGYAELGAKEKIETQERRVMNFLRQRAERGAFNVHVDIQYMVSAGQIVIGNGLLESMDQVWKLFIRWLSLSRHLEDHATGGDLDPVQSIDPIAMSSPLTPDVRGDTSLKFPLAHGINLVVKSGCSFGNTMLPRELTVIPTENGKCPFNYPSRVMCIFVDGSVSFCSLDYENSVSIGNICDQSIDSIWKSQRMQRTRMEMEKGRLIEPLCQRCQGKVVREEIVSH